jgi:hypothetical protein
MVFSSRRPRSIWSNWHPMLGCVVGLAPIALDATSIGRSIEIAEYELIADQPTVSYLLPSVFFFKSLSPNRRRR